MRTFVCIIHLIITLAAASPTESTLTNMSCNETIVVLDHENDYLVACAFLWFSHDTYDDRDELWVRQPDPSKEEQQCHTLYSFEVNMEPASLCGTSDGFLAVTVGGKQHWLNYCLMEQRWTRTCIQLDALNYKWKVFVDTRLYLSIDHEISHKNSSAYENVMTDDQTEMGGNQNNMSYVLNELCQRQNLSMQDSTIILQLFQVVSLEDELLHFNCSSELEGEVHYVSSGIAENEYDLCDRKNSIIVINETMNHQELITYCTKVGGSILSDVDAKTIATEISNFDSPCRGEEIVSWIDNGYDNNLGLWCSVLFANRTVSKRSCYELLKCALCKITDGHTVTLFGHLNQFDRYYSLIASKSGDLFLRGHGNSFIQKINEKWVLKSTIHDSICYIIGSGLPFVRLNWTCESENKLLALSLCSINEFSCDSGICLPEDNRCNGIGNCEDGSDEKNCEYFIKSPGYNVAQQPPVEHGETFVKFNYFYEVFSIDDIRTSNFYADVDLKISMTWKDLRLKLYNPEDNERIDCSQIWSPTFTATDGFPSGHLVSIPDPHSHGCRAKLDNNKLLEKLFYDPFMGSSIEWKDFSLTYAFNGVFRIPCRFDLRKYPFADQKCELDLWIDVQSYSSVRFEENSNESVEYYGRKNVGEFSVKNISTKGITSNHSVLLTIELSSFYGYHLLNSFFTSLLILLISFATFFFKVQDFNERIMVSLTALLVLTALFTQANSTSVSTPYLKLLDVWYAVLITCTFLNVVANTILDRVHHSLKINWNSSNKDDAHNDLLTVARKMEKYNLICFLVLFGGFIVFVLFFILLAADIL